MIKKASFIAVAMLLSGGTAQAFDRIDWEDIVAPYRARIDGMTSSSGNAQRVNTVTHFVTPWPRYVRNRRIPANGERMADAVERYRNRLKPEGGATQAKAPPPAGVANAAAGAGGGAGAGAAGGGAGGSAGTYGQGGTGTGTGQGGGSAQSEQSGQ